MVNTRGCRVHLLHFKSKRIFAELLRNPHANFTKNMYSKAKYKRASFVERFHNTSIRVSILICIAKAKIGIIIEMYQITQIWMISVASCTVSQRRPKRLENKMEWFIYFWITFNLLITFGHTKCRFVKISHFYLLTDIDCIRTKFGTRCFHIFEQQTKKRSGFDS